MLQQTQVATVIDYFNRFVKKFPTVKKLAAANETEVLKLWEGLGYYRRARQMHAAARQIVAEFGGKFPTEFEQVLALPGIGRYTAGAILSISLDQRQPILEGNTIRLFARLVGLKTDPRSTANQKVLWEFSESLLPKKRVGDFNQALMEVGNQICLPKNPRCDQCPLLDRCATFANGWQTKIPVASKPVKYEEITEAVVLVQRRGKFLVRQCDPGQRWAGLWDFPRYRVETQQGRELADFLQNSLQSEFGMETSLLPTEIRIQHAVTRFRISLLCFRSATVAGRLSKSKTNCRWLTIDELADLPMSVTGRKIAKKLNSK